MAMPLILKSPAVAVPAMVLNVAVSFLWVLIYSILIAPGQDEAAYQAHLHACPTPDDFWTKAPAADWMLDLVANLWRRLPRFPETELRTFALRCAEGLGETGGTRQNRFVSEWSFTSQSPGAEQPGLAVTASPDDGAGSRMSFVRRGSATTCAGPASTGSIRTICCRCR